MNCRSKRIRNFGELRAYLHSLVRKRAYQNRIILLKNIFLSDHIADRGIWIGLLDIVLDLCLIILNGLLDQCGIDICH